MAKHRFDFVTPDCVAAMNEAGAVFERGDDYIMVYTGPDIPPQPVPEVDDIQIREAMNEMGLRAAVEQFVAQADQRVRDWWDRAQWFQIDNEMVQAAASALGVTREQLVALFRLAATKQGHMVRA